MNRSSVNISTTRSSGTISSIRSLIYTTSCISNISSLIYITSCISNISSPIYTTSSISNIWSLINNTLSRIFPRILVSHRIQCLLYFLSLERVLNISYKELFHIIFKRRIDVRCAPHEVGVLNIPLQHLAPEYVRGSMVQPAMLARRIVHSCLGV